MASDSAPRSGGLPTQHQVIELLDGEFTRAGYEIESVHVDTTARPPRITVVADGDEPPDLDAVATLSRSASELLDTLDLGPDGNGEYVLEVTSPGVERPLTSARHFRRARGRKVELTLADGSQLTGRLGACEDDVLALVIPGRGPNDLSVRKVPIKDVVNAVVQVEFSAPSQREMELAGQSVTEVRQ